MNKYSIYCTQGQTKKALELGAPIDNSSNSFDSECTDNIERLSNGLYAIIPTTEQMLCWLEGQGIQVSIMFSYRVSPKRWNYDLDNNSIILFEHKSMGYTSRKEATLAAIDAALEYLTTNKK